MFSTLLKDKPLTTACGVEVDQVAWSQLPVLLDSLWSNSQRRWCRRKPVGYSCVFSLSFNAQFSVIFLLLSSSPLSQQTRDEENSGWRGCTPPPPLPHLNFLYFRNLVLSFLLGSLPCPYITTTSIFPQHLRGGGCAPAVSSAFVLSTCGSKI